LGLTAIQILPRRTAFSDADSATALMSSIAALAGRFVLHEKRKDARQRGVVHRNLPIAIMSRAWPRIFGAAVKTSEKPRAGVRNMMGDGLPMAVAPFH
jgi:hypothetical protein